MGFKEARNKYGRIRITCPTKYQWKRLSSRYAEENLSCHLSIFQDSNRQQEWVLRIKEIILCRGLEL